MRVAYSRLARAGQSCSHRTGAGAPGLFSFVPDRACHQARSRVPSRRAQKGRDQRRAGWLLWILHSPAEQPRDCEVDAGVPPYAAALGRVAAGRDAELDVFFFDWTKGRPLVAPESRWGAEGSLCYGAFLGICLTHLHSLTIMSCECFHRVRFSPLNLCHAFRHTCGRSQL